ncbi:sensor histidine kinase [Paenibacillus sp.]|uniref:sensor histidine kinase n=1 Tax=Paenibacillus sp. TaxID=58172 RepID=UPI002810A35F|nr:sensor histidine kinase [Paenibacillus sp.]
MKRSIDLLFNRLRLNQKLFLSYLTVIIVPIFVLGMYAYGQSRELLDYQAEQSVERDATTLAQSIGGSIEQYNRALQSIVYNRTFQRIVANDYLDLVNLSRDLNEYLAPYFTMMRTVDSNIRDIKFYTQSDVPEYGEAVVSAERAKGEPWYEEAIAGEGEHWVFDGEELLFVRTFPRFFSDPYINAAVIRIHHRGLFFGVTDLMDGYGVAITDDSNKLLYANRNDLREIATEVTKRVNPTDSTVTVEDIKYFVVKKTISETGWTLHCFVPAERVTPNAGSILNATLIVIASCIIFLLFIISVFSRTMIRRIHQLNSFMKRVENGDLQLRVQSASKDEIGELINRFDNMVFRLNELIRESYASKIIQQEAELKALQSQIKPHFLYNTLSFINWEAVKSGQTLISHVVTAMSKFYRTTLNKGDHLIPAKDELETVKSYLEILLIMNDDGFDVDYEIDESVYSGTMLNMTLQPIVENAVMHGIQKKEGGRGKLRVAAATVGPAIEFIVEDNGPGMDEETVESLLSEQSVGYGLKNVNKRLKLYFGTKYALRIESEPGRGTRMRIAVPANGRPDK